MEKGSVGSSVGTNTVDQLTARSDIFSRENKTIQDLLLTQSNTPWVMLRSSVNRFTGGKIRRKGTGSKIYNTRDLVSLDELSEESDRILKVDYKTTNQEAKNYILSAGTRSTEGSREGISFKPGTLDTAKIYSNTSKLGIRPMPGITGLNVKSKNTYGTLLEAEVKFVVWTLEDLEACELLYFRPGYTALVEWGHSVWVDSSNMASPRVRETGGEYMAVSDDEFFRESSFLELDKKIQLNRTKFCGNYDGIFGFITNFSFSLRPDMGYDCMVRVVSRGIVLEGLKVFPVSTSGTLESPLEEVPEKQLKSIFHYIFLTLEQSSEQKNQSRTIEQKKTLEKLEPSLVDITLEKEGLDFTMGKKEIAEGSYKNGQTKKGDRWFNGRTHLESYYSSKKEGISNVSKFLDDFLVFQANISTEGTGFEEDDRPRLINYIRLGDFLMLVNRLNSVGAAEGKDSIVKFRLKEGQKFETFDNHYSLDPFVAILPKPPKDQGDLEYTRTLVGKSSSTSEYSVQMDTSTYRETLTESSLVKRDCQFRETLHTGMQLHAERLGGTDDILNIYISTRMIESELDRAFQDETRESGIYDAILGVLQRVETALGGINHFGIANNSITNILEVVDREHTEHKDEVPEIDLTGLRSTMKEVTISSTVSSQVASQVAIAAQGNVNSALENLGVLLEWNAGAIDRHLPVKVIGIGTESEIERKVKYIVNLSKAYRQIREFDRYKAETFQNLRTEGVADIQSIYRSSRTEKKDPVRGVVPVELSIKLLGIHGFVVGSAFRIKPGLLPRKYDNWGYIVTGLEHNIGLTGNWETSIKTQFYSVRSVERSKEGTSSSVKYTTTGEETSRAVDIGDPAPIINPGRIGAQAYNYSPLGIKITTSGKKGNLQSGDRLTINSDRVSQGKDNKQYYTVAKEAWASCRNWLEAMDAAKINYRISSGYRDTKRNTEAGGASNSPHLYGGAIDFGNLYQIVGGSTDPGVNMDARKKHKIYKQMAELGAKFGWYNPWRLSDTGGMDEIWHFEYWGPA